MFVSNFVSEVLKKIATASAQRLVYPVSTLNCVKLAQYLLFTVLHSAAVFVTFNLAPATL